MVKQYEMTVMKMYILKCILCYHYYIMLPLTRMTNDMDEFLQANWLVVELLGWYLIHNFLIGF